MESRSYIVDLIRAAFDVYENSPFNTSTDKTMWEEQKLVIDDINRKGSMHYCMNRDISFKLASLVAE